MRDSHPPYYYLFADSLADNLADDMQKECLKGRTLTLKLKTAAFEVFIFHLYNINQSPVIIGLRSPGESFCSWLIRLINHLNQVRTRAVTTQNYINSKEDILIYARKLLKAELPLSLRLMGKHELPQYLILLLDDAQVDLAVLTAQACDYAMVHASFLTLSGM